ncbi:hypothetical protein [Niallia taxi]|uniref:hypothetical protein n=1 Tax=Niallia taxi TaxID=2499688 RepID=UPI0035998250
MNEEKVVYHNGEEIIVKLGEYNHLLGKYFASAWYKKYPGSTAFYQHQDKNKAMDGALKEIMNVGLQIIKYL